MNTPRALPSRTLTGLVVLTAGCIALSGCSSVKKVFGSKDKADEPVALGTPVRAPGASAAPSAGAGGGLSTGNAFGSDAPAPKFIAPTPTGKGAPPLSSVPSKAPTPPTSKADREKVTEGLMADRDKARYTDQGGRTLPVAVRPLNEASAAPDPVSTVPPKPQAAKIEPVTKLGAQAAPGAATAPNADTLAARAASPPPPLDPDAPPPKAAASPAVPKSALGPAAAPVEAAEMAGPRLSTAPAARNDEFRPLGAYDATSSAANNVAAIDFSGTGTSLSAADRRLISDAAKLGQRAKGVFRIIGRTSAPSNIAQERATTVARELQRLGVAPGRIYVGTDTGSDGRVDVILDQ